MKAALDAYGRIDCFFNNAGIEGKVAPLAEYDEAVFDQVIGVNVKGVFLGLRYVLPVMLEQKSGAIVNTASVAGLVGTPGIGPYVASKHAVIGLTKTASGEVARSGIRVNAICPGPIDTRMIHSLELQINPADPASIGARYQAMLPIGRYGTPEEVAKLVLFLVLGPRRQHHRRAVRGSTAARPRRPKRVQSNIGQDELTSIPQRINTAPDTEANRGGILVGVETHGRCSTAPRRRASIHPTGSGSTRRRSGGSSGPRAKSPLHVARAKGTLRPRCCLSTIKLKKS